MREGGGAVRARAVVLRDDGPLPDTITDMNLAQDAYAEQLEGRGCCTVPGLHAAFDCHGNMLPSWVKIVCVDINPAVATKVERSRDGASRWSCHGRRPVFGIARGRVRGEFEMKRQYTDDHAGAGTRAPLPDIEVWPNQYPTGYEIEIVMPEFTSICPKTGLAGHGNAHADLCSGENVPRTEVAQDVHHRVSEPRHLPGERGQSHDGGHRAGL